MRSMTGFGRGEASNAEMTATAEISGLNRKQAEIVPQVPRHLASALDPRVRKLVQSQVSRGRVQVSLKLEHNRTPKGPKIDSEAARAYFAAIAELEMLRGESIQITPGDLREFLDTGSAEEDPESLWPLCEEAIQAAMQAFTTMKKQEGAHLKSDTLQRLQHLADTVEAMATRAPAVVENYRKSLHQRLAEADIDVPLDDERLVREIGLFAERSDITEELTRLRSHLAKFHEFIASDDSIGRPLDFLCQETHREFNTIGSKANDAPLAQLVVDAKTELEKLREQIQNVE